MIVSFDDILLWKPFAIRFNCELTQYFMLSWMEFVQNDSGMILMKRKVKTSFTLVNIFSDFSIVRMKYFCQFSTTLVASWQRIIPKEIKSFKRRHLASSLGMKNWSFSKSFKGLNKTLTS